MLKGRDYFQQEIIWDQPHENRSDGTSSQRQPPREDIIGLELRKEIVARGRSLTIILREVMMKPWELVILLRRREWRKKQSLGWRSESSYRILNSLLCCKYQTHTQNHRILKPREPFEITSILQVEKYEARREKRICSRLHSTGSCQKQDQSSDYLKYLTLPYTLLHPLILHCLLSHPQKCI